MRVRMIVAMVAILGGPVHLATYIPACPEMPTTTVDFVPVMGKQAAPRDTRAAVAVYRKGQSPPPGFERLGLITVQAGHRNTTFTSLLALARPQACLHGGQALVDLDSTSVDGRPQLVAEVVRYTPRQR